MLFTTAFVSSLLFSGAVYAQNGNQAPQNGQSGQNGQNGQNAQTDQNGQNAQNGQSAQNAQGMVNVHVVQVGDAQGSKKFYPESLTANPGEMVQFQFHPKNHSIVQSDFSAPCAPINDVQPDVVGIKSGFMPVAAGSNEWPVFTMMINNTDPLWIYCGAEGHCQGGMVMAINAAATGEKTLVSYKSLAANAVSGTAPAPPAGSAPADGSTGSTGTTDDGGDAASSGAASGTPTSSGGPVVSTGGANSMQAMSGVGFAGLFVAAVAFIGL